MVIERVRERLQRTVRTLDEVKVPYAVIGGNAVAEWMVYRNLHRDCVLRRCADKELFSNGTHFNSSRRKTYGGRTSANALTHERLTG